MARETRYMTDSHDNIITLLNEIRKGLEAASVVKASLVIKPYYNDMVKNENNSDSRGQ
jgi:hypothetical protein